MGLKGDRKCDSAARRKTGIKLGHGAHGEGTEMHGGFFCLSQARSAVVGGEQETQDLASVRKGFNPRSLQRGDGVKRGAVSHGEASCPDFGTPLSQ